MSPTTTVLTTPAPGTVVGPIYEYSEEQQAKMAELREYAGTVMLPSSDDYYPWELRWLNQPDTIPRYMRSAKWDLPDAKKRILATLEWRREFKPDLIRPDEVKIESETGKIIINGFDKDGRPIIYMRPGRENTETSPRQLRHLVWCLERAKDLMPPGQESLVIIVDYKSTTLRTNPSISVARKVLNILQQHYVETLGRAIVVNLPFLLNFFYKGIAPFLDPVTRDKMRFNPDLFELVPASQLDADFGGEHEYEFEPESYWDQIIAACGVTPEGTRVDFPPPGVHNTSQSASSNISSISDNKVQADVTAISVEAVESAQPIQIAS
ncbi:CRAL-TRIO domain-containing protein C23B6.04c [Psilocybe cubensis]|uniref:CRAL-TRIO domain-containing protein n=2 Tax=Psilocybe cubensis TaxID=181762 RepID=A0A8H7YAL0_PSICU|nr:CRAL-TRIO domain-containing protein C23B6.04c [Psilocybe cubensis]KAH9486476.1 CRAL-TRIO domain-containing protein C23B6.04c [Psilocybe cubensis]